MAASHYAAASQRTKRKDAWGYISFFNTTALLGVPVIALVWLAGVVTPALAFKKAFSENSVAALDAAFGADIIWVSETDAKNFACNAVVLDHTLVMHKASAELKAALVQRGLEVIEAGMSEFMKSGGSCKCLTLEI